MARPKRLFLLAALALALAAGLLLMLSDGPRAASIRDPGPRFRHSLRADEMKRVEARRSLPPSPDAPPDPLVSGPPKPQRRDPFLVALPHDPKQPLVVLEANALRHSRLGELFLECLFSRPGKDPFEPIREFGIDPLKDIDRVAVTEQGIVVSGFFERARFDQIESESDVESYGAGRLFTPRTASGVEAPSVLGTWGPNVLVFGERPFVAQAVDRVEGRIPASAPIIPESLTYGEAYGVVSGVAIAELFGAQSDLGRKLAAVASRIELHADAMRDVVVTAKVSGADERSVEDLGSALGAAMAVARLQARARGDDRFVQLLEYARVIRGSGEFWVELAIPVAALEEWFAGCGARPAPASR
jgi:hypothetical protein